MILRGSTGSGVGGSWGAPSATRPPSNINPGNPTLVSRVTSSQTTHGHGGTAVSDGQCERQLVVVMELCPPVGLKAEPPASKLQNFAQTISSLYTTLVCPALLDCLEEGQPWIICAKALWVMEACIAVISTRIFSLNVDENLNPCRAMLDQQSGNLP